MKIIPCLSASALALAVALGACSSETPSGSAPVSQEPQATPAIPSTEAQPASPAEGSPAIGAVTVLGLEGLGDLRIDQPVPAGGSWGERGAQEGGVCHTVSSPDYPGVYAIVTDDKVQRITVGQRSTVRLAEGVGVGSTEADVMKWFAGFREEPHKYEPAPAKYLTAPNAVNGSSALRFEIGADGKVKMIHVGVMPVLAYVEGCS